jgi:hypothetical protein
VASKDGRVFIDRIELTPITPETFAAGSDVAKRNAANARILRRLDRASTPGLERFADLLESLTDEQLDEVASFAIALVDNPFGEVG